VFPGVANQVSEAWNYSKAVVRKQASEIRGQMASDIGTMQHGLRDAASDTVDAYVIIGTETHDVIAGAADTIGSSPHALDVYLDREKSSEQELDEANRVLLDTTLMLVPILLEARSAAVLESLPEDGSAVLRSSSVGEEMSQAARVPQGPGVIVPFYPPNNGFLGKTTRVFLRSGERIDRYGGSKVSRFFSPAGTANGARALPPGTTGQSLKTFEVVKPFEVEAGTVAPAYGQAGFGVQYRSPVQLEVLLRRGIIREVKP